MRVTEKKFDQLLSNVRGSYLGLAWGVVDGNGERCDDEVLKEGRYVCAENAYTYMVLAVQKNEAGELILVEVERESED